MPSGAIGGLVSGVTGIIGASKSAKAAKDAARIQAEASVRAAELQLEGTTLGIEENTRQFDLTQQLLSPYTDAGPTGVQGQLDIAGYGEPGAQQAAIDQILGGSEYQEQVRLGEQSILQNASATGGLRGGNVQASLAQFRPSILNNLLNQQFARAGVLANRGVGAAGRVGGLGADMAQQNANLYQAGGTASAQGVLGAGNAQAAGLVNSANAWQQGLGAISGGFNQAFGGGGGIF